MMTNSNIFTIGSLYSFKTVRGKVKKDNLIPYHCGCCDTKDEWNGKPLNLELDHKNGIRSDNRLENLRWLCPNCHSQQTTTNAKKKQLKRISDFIPEILVLSKSFNYRQILLKLGFSEASANYKALRKILTENNISIPEYKQNKESRKHLMHPGLPEKEVLSKMVWEMPHGLIAKKLNVSKASIRRWIKMYGIENPPKNYWSSGQRNGTFKVSDKFNAVVIAPTTNR